MAPPATRGNASDIQLEGGSNAPHNTIIMLPSPSCITKFYGNGESTLVQEQFEDEIRQAWALQPQFSEKQMMNLILNNCGPNVKAELSMRKLEINDKPEAALKVIREQFGENRSALELLSLFTREEQRLGENNRNFSQRLHQNFLRLQTRQRNTANVVSPDTVLRDQFIRAINDSLLRQILSEKVHSEPGISFLEIREQSLRWEERNSLTEQSRCAATEVKTSLDMDRLVQEVTKEVTKNLNETLNRFMTNQTQHRPIRCYGCQQEGHIRRNCPKEDSSRRYGLRMEQKHYNDIARKNTRQEYQAPIWMRNRERKQESDSWRNRDNWNYQDHHTREIERQSGKESGNQARPQ